MPDLPALDALVAGTHVVAIPMRTRFRGVSVREAVLVEGPGGWGEFAPFLEYGDVEAARWLAAAVEAAYHGWPPARRTTVPANATIPAVAPAAVEPLLRRYAGCTTAKVKVAQRGQALTDDVARVAEVRRLLGPAGRVRVDANGGWSVAEATEALGRLTAYGLEYAEQPCAQVAELAELRVRLARAGLDVLVAADESVRRAEDPMRVARMAAADLVVLKVAPLGGVAAALRIAQECGLPAVVSSALDTSVGIAAGVALAAALPELPYACGLGTVELLAGDVCEPSSVPVDGSLPVRAAVPDVALLDRWAAPESRRGWWVERLRRCWEVLDG